MIDDAKMIQKRCRIDATFFYNINDKKAQGEETTDDMRLREMVGEEKLIMHSMLTGQNFILERK